MSDTPQAPANPNPIKPAGETDTSSTPSPTSKLLALAIGSVGVVYGDIGTSPLYAFRAAVLAATGSGIALEDAVIGVLSLILWSLVMVVTGKYVLLLLRADNNGEGGTFALMALAQSAVPKRTWMIGLFGMIGASFFMGDAVITPAISVLSAIEGLELIAPSLDSWVLPLAIIVLSLLFAAQPYGTARVATYFGPIMLVWFAALAAGGLVQILANPGILKALAPWYALGFIATHQIAGFLILGLVFLAVTGAEALYADLGHFGHRPIRLAWLTVVFPALVINYFGQGALVLAAPEMLANPFYRLYPSFALVPMVLLATMATVIASQAVISGAYSLARQAIQLGLLPRFAVRHTSAKMPGQIYMPRINWLLYTAVLFVAVFFETSSNLAAAYGIAVAVDMTISSLLAFFALQNIWRWSPRRVALVIAPFLTLELSFLAANSSKLLMGAWLPIVIATICFTTMWSWRNGARLLAKASRRNSADLKEFVRDMEQNGRHFIPGTAVFFSPDPTVVPTAMLHNLKHNQILHDRNFILTIATQDTPFVPVADRFEIEVLNPHITTIVARYGFVQTPNVPRLLALLRTRQIEIDLESTSFFLSKRAVYTTYETEMPGWQKPIFKRLHHIAESVGDYYRIPRERIIEIGTQIAL